MAKTPQTPTRNPASKADIKVKPTTKTESSAKTESSVRVARRRPRVMPWLIAIAAAAVVGLLIWAKLSGLIPGDQAEDPVAVAMGLKITALEQRLMAIEGQRDALAAALAAAKAAAAGLDSLDGRMAAIETRPPVVPQQIDLGPLEARFAALEAAYTAGRDETTTADGAVAELVDRVVALEARPTSLNTNPLPFATLLAVAQLRAALRGPGRFDAALAALEALGDTGDGGNIAAAIAVLTPHAATGIATLEKLRERFTALAEEIPRGGGASGKSWVERSLARLSGLITLRRIGGDVGGDTAEAVVARAEAYLGIGDLAAAVAEIAALDGAAADVAASWLADAQARLAAEDALTMLDAQAIAAIGKN